MTNIIIDTIVKYIIPSDKVIDVGCDHAFLGEILSKRNQSSIASDKVKSIIENLRKNKKNKYITYICNDGLKNLRTDYDTVVLSGMGTHTILKILKNSNLAFNKIIVSSNNKLELLRKEINDLGFIIENEEIVLFRKKYYNIIVFIKGNIKYSDREYFIGVNHVNKDLFDKKKELLHKKYTNLLNSVNLENEKIEIKKKIEYLM